MRLIVNADDFGRSSDINRAVLQAHREGILTSASLMVGGEGFEEAVELARQTPSLAVGLHLVVAGGPAVLPREQIPHLVDASGNFPNTPIRTGLRYLLDRVVRQELALEIRAQFERFAATGLPLSHVDGHLSMHVHPTVLRIVLPLAQQYGARGFRLPRDDVALSLRHDWRNLGGCAPVAIGLDWLSARCERHLHRYGLRAARRTYGLVYSGRMREPYVIALLSEVHEPLAEICFHPTLGPRLEPLGPNPADLRTLLSPAVRRIIRARGMQLTNYAALNGVA